MQIFVKLLTGNVLNITVDPYDTIKLVKFKIRRVINIPTYSQTLYLNDSPLNDELTISNYNIQPGTMLKLIVKMRTGF
jgi:hypothetical protein